MDQQSQPTQSAQPAPQQQQGQGKKTNIGMIILIIVLVLIVLGGVGGYLIYAKAKKVIKDNTTSTSTSTTTGTTGTTGATGTDVYGEAKDNTPTDAFTISINTDVKPVLATIFTAAKLNSYASSGTDYTTISYAVKKAVTVADAPAIESALTAKGWTKTQNVTSSEGVMLYFTKGDDTLILQYQISLPNEVIVSATKSSSTE